MAMTAQAAASLGLGMCLSTLATTPMEEVVEAYRGAESGKGLKVFQLYVYRDKQTTLGLVRRAEAAGFDAIAVTVDVPTFVG